MVVKLARRQQPFLPQRRLVGTFHENFQYSWAVQTAQIPTDFWPFFVGFGVVIPTDFDGRQRGVPVAVFQELLSRPPASAPECAGWAVSFFLILTVFAGVNGLGGRISALFRPKLGRSASGTVCGPLWAVSGGPTGGGVSPAEGQE